MSFGGVERCKDDRFCGVVPKIRVLCGLKWMLSEIFIISLSMWVTAVSVETSNVIVCEFFPHDLLLVLCEYLDFIWNILHPWMCHDLLDCVSFIWVYLKNVFDQFPCLFRDLLLQLILSFHNKLMQLIHGPSFKWHCPI